MKLKIVNETKWRTDHLRRFIRETLKRHGEPPKLHVTILDSKRDRCHGRAWLNGVGMKLWLVPERKFSSERSLAPIQKRYLKKLRERGGVTDTGVDRVEYADRQERQWREPEIALDKRAIACLIAHEAAHNRGVEHADMSNVLMFYDDWRDHFEFADELSLETKPEREKSKRKTGVALAKSKLEHARAMLKKARTREKRATTIRKKWQQKVRYYEKRIDALDEIEGDAV